MDYKEAGVDIEAGNTFAKNIASKCGMGLGFAAELDLSGYSNPIISTSTDGIGTKMNFHQDNNNLYNAGIDLVAMVVNDIICTGASPIGFLDYIGVNNIKYHNLDRLMDGIIAGCKEAGAKLLGGETAEMFTVHPNVIELAGFGIGVRERDDKFLPICKGDKLIGLPSSGFHANGFSLINKVLEDSCLYIDDDLRNILCTPTRIYTKDIKSFKRYGVPLKGIANITGGGVRENVSRILQGHKVVYKEWIIPSIYKWLQRLGNISDEEMHRTFNMGVGLVVIVPSNCIIKDGIDIGYIRS